MRFSKNKTVNHFESQKTRVTDTQDSRGTKKDKPKTVSTKRRAADGRTRSEKRK